MTERIPAPALATARRSWPVAWLAGALRSQGLMWQEAGCRLLKRPLPSVRYARRLGEGRRFELRRGSFASVLLPMVLLSTLVDMPLCHGAIQVMVAAPHRLPLHLLALMLNAWTLAWALSLRSAMHHVDHVLAADHLTLAIGFDQWARIPLAAIRAVHVVDRKAADWGAAQQLRRRDVTVMTSFDPPTLLIALHPDSRLRFEKNGVARPLCAWVAVYVDHPAELQAALRASAA